MLEFYIVTAEWSMHLLHAKLKDAALSCCRSR